MKRILVIALVLCLCAAGAYALDVPPLSPIALSLPADSAPVALYCGPTQGSYRSGEANINLSEPFVYFGQYDCWAMVASGTPEALGQVGWVESAAANFPYDPQLGFEDALPAMIEEDTFLTDAPMAAEPPQLMPLPRGAQVTLLGTLGDWVYVQYEGDALPVRAFVPIGAVQ